MKYATINLDTTPFAEGMIKLKVRWNVKNIISLFVLACVIVLPQAVFAQDAKEEPSTDGADMVLPAE